MARGTNQGKSLLANPKAHDLVSRLLTDSDIAETRDIVLARKNISLMLSDFHEGATIAPNKLQQWIDDLC